MFQFFLYVTSILVAILVGFFLQAYLYPTFRPNHWFQSWLPEIVSIADGPYCMVFVAQNMLL